MWSITVIFPYAIRFTFTPRGLLVAGALLAAAVLLGLYAMLLHHSVQRSEQLRTEQRTRVAASSSEKTAHYVSFSRATAVAARP
jgi:uncharacterized membrane protein